MSPPKRPILNLIIPQDSYDNTQQTHNSSAEPILTQDETDSVIEKSDPRSDYTIDSVEWKVKNDFTTNENGGSIPCSVQFIKLEDNTFRKLYKYYCINESSIRAKLYAEIFFQQKAYDLINNKNTNDTNTQLNHVFIPEIYNYGELFPTNKENDYCYFYIDMEYVKLPTLQTLINPIQDDSIKNPNLQQLEQPKTFNCNPIDIIVGNIDEFLKTNNIVHNDLNPNNILINTNTNPMDIYIIDFGEARKTNEGRSGKGSSTPLSVCGGKQTRRKLCKPKRARCHRTRKYTKCKKRITTSRNNRKHRH